MTPGIKWNNMNNTSKDSNDLKNKGSDLIKHMLQKQKNWKTQAITSEVKSEEPRNTGSCTGNNMLDAKTTRNYIASGLKSLSVSGSATVSYTHLTLPRR